MHFILMFFILVVPVSKKLPALIAESKFQVIDQKQKEVTRIDIDSRTKIYLNGKRTKFEDIPEGAEIELIRYNKNKKRVIEIRFILKTDDKEKY